MGVAGIYIITNNTNGKVYIGQSWDIMRRWASHRCNERCPYLAMAFKKYGIENFSFSILEEMQDPSQELLDLRESYYAELFRSHDQDKGYNLRECGSHGKLSEETKLKCSIAAKGRKHSDGSKIKMSQQRKGLPSKKKGIPRSEETKKKISETLKLNPNRCWLGRKHSDESKQKIRESWEKRRQERKAPEPQEDLE